MPPIGTLDDRPILPDGTLLDGRRVLAPDPKLGRFQPVQPPPLALDGRSRIRLLDGALWAFDERAGRFVAPAHGRAQLERRLDELTREAALLSPRLAARVQPLLRIIASVSVVEGSLTEAPAHRPGQMGSLGIFQWSAPRDPKLGGGSALGVYFARLRDRALAAEEPLYVAAWKELEAQHLELAHGQLLLKGRAVSGGELEQRLARVFGRGALRTYQLVAAADEVEAVRATVGNILPGQAALAEAVSLAINRPAWLKPTLAAISPSGAPVAEHLFRAAALARYPEPERDRRARRLVTALLLEEGWPSAVSH